MGRKKHITHLKEFKRRLSRDIPVDKMILFGSRAHGNPHRWSDFDVMVVSKKFRNVDSLKRSLGFHEYWDLNYPVDFVCYTPKEFNKLKKMITIVRDAVKEGVEI